MKVLNSLRTAKERHPDCQIVKRKGCMSFANLILVLKLFRDAKESVNSEFSRLITFFG